jgi:hypothetical protein
MQHIKKIYLYAVSLVSLVMLVIAAVILINLGLKTWVFTKADNYRYYEPPAASTCVTPDDKNCQPISEEERARLAKENQSSQKQQDAAHAVAMILVAAPVFYYHWRLAKKEQ